jgi:hypothetical protein
MKEEMAVDWLVEFIQDHCIRIPENIILKVQLMQKQQMIDFAYKALTEAHFNSNNECNVYELYNETFKNK